MSVGRGDQHIVIELVGPDTGLDESDIADGVESRLGERPGVAIRQSRFNADLEVLANLGGTIVTKEEVIETERAVRREINDNRANLQVREWRVEVL